MINDLEIQRVIRMVAQQSGMPAKQVRKNIEQMLEESRSCPGAEAEAAWSAIPRRGETPTLEEVMNYIADQVRQKT